MSDVWHKHMHMHMYMYMSMHMSMYMYVHVHVKCPHVPTRAKQSSSLVHAQTWLTGHFHTRPARENAAVSLSHSDGGSAFTYARMGRPIAFCTTCIGRSHL